jgi:hypothetical protein
MQFVDLHRQFRNLTEEELADPSLLAALREHYGGVGWQQLLNSRRVVILAEAGSGKTREMQAAAARLIADGKAAFFLPIEALHQEDVRDVLAMEHGEAERFDAWLASDQPAWFFLDAVDELRLVHGKLDNALGKVTRALGGAHSRARIVISCRPTDWRPVTDMETLNKRFPQYHSQPQPDVPISEEAAFLQAFDDPKEKKEEKDDEVPELRVVVLFPLKQEQMKTFAEACGVADADAFLKEISRHDAWSFARRPLDLSELAAIWKERKRLGTRLEQHEIDVENNLRERPDRHDDAVLSRDKVHDGAERLALALILTGSRTIRAPEQAIEQDRGTTSIVASEILTDWTDAEVRTLLRRSIFDPATYGRVRFHHRSVQEFLAARRLAKLREQGMTARQLERLLFADLYEERVAIPSMNGVSAWLARDDQNVARELLAREPENLIVYGDPETLPLDVRSTLLESFVDAYGGGAWRGMYIPHAEARRLAQPDLAPTIRNCWGRAYTNEEVPEFLLQLIWVGEIDACMDIAREAAFDQTRGRRSRGFALLALSVGKRLDDLREVAENMLRHPECWPEKLAYERIDCLFPGSLTITELETLIRRTREPKDVTSGFGWELQELVQGIDASAISAIELRDLMADLIWEGRDTNATWHNASSRFGYLVPALVRLCDRQADAIQTPMHIRACVIANRFHSREHLHDDELDVLRLKLGAGDQSLRRELFRQELALTTQLDENKEAAHQFFVVCHSAAMELRPSDWEWILGLAREDGDERGAALHAAIHVWARRGRTKEDLAVLREAIADRNDLLTRLTYETEPKEPDPHWIEHEEKMAAYEARRRQARSENRRDWQEWRNEIVAHPGEAFASEKLGGTLANLIKWLRIRGRSGNSIAEASWREIRRAFSDDIADRFEEALRRYWRDTEPPLRSRRAPEDQSSITHGMVRGLTGLLIEATRPDWVHDLDHALAIRAAEWAMIEMTLPDWFSMLIAAHPTAVAEALENEIEYELTHIDSGYASVLSTIDNGNDELRRVIAPRIKERLPKLDGERQRESHRTSALDHVLSILSRTHRGDKSFADQCEIAFLSNATGSEALTWLAALAISDTGRAMAAMKEALETIAPGQRDDHAVMWLGAMFGRGGRSRHVPLDCPADVLADLVRFAYKWVRRENDAVHDGSYSPDARDDAETARNHVLNALLERPGLEAHDAILALANDPLLFHIRDRLRLKAKEGAARDSEPAPISPAAFADFDALYERAPANRDELARVLGDRLSDINYDLHHHDFNDRHVLRQITQERDIQPLLARKFEDAARNAYRVSREEEVADKNKTDIRLAATAFSGRAVVEIKIGDNNSVSQLEETLETQILDQYLRHQNCNVGCLLVTYAGRKGFADPDGVGALSFEGVLRRLTKRAEELELQEKGRVRIFVAGFDLR